MRIVSIFSALIMTFCIACASEPVPQTGTGNETPTDTGENAGEETGGNTGAGDGTGGGNNGNGNGNGGGNGGGGNLSSAPLGTLCDDVNVCADGYICLKTNPETGYCTLLCSQPGLPDVCAAANGYAGVGDPYCGLNVQGNSLCAISCGSNNNNDPSCPEGLTCSEPDGFCFPPAPVAP